MMALQLKDNGAPYDGDVRVKESKTNAGDFTVLKAKKNAILKFLHKISETWF